jgi:NADPH:quinone reductase-like Zn-dependent oxidoreductase
MTRDRFDITNCTATMKAVVTTGNGGYDKLVYRDVPVPVPGTGEVLIRVLAAGVNNTEINTRLWRSDIGGHLCWELGRSSAKDG